ncbi:hypothetical protein DFJ74DRAFT_775422 [Hyaloraphidium curvatum]|nr:hypothetical protein DFJ74DRAFT_775422 [Hyaloraphidium curvatum]
MAASGRCRAKRTSLLSSRKPTGADDAEEDNFALILVLAYALVSVGVLGRPVPGWEDASAVGDLADRDTEGNIADSCDRCGDEAGALLRCGRCRVARYCGAECQRAAWAAHKDACSRCS